MTIAIFSSVALALTMPLPGSAFDALLASGGPKWVWAALLMAGFVALSALTMALTRIPARHTPPPLVPPPSNDEQQERDPSGAVEEDSLGDG